MYNVLYNNAFRQVIGEVWYHTRMWKHLHDRIISEREKL